MDPRGTVGRIYKEDHYTLLHTKYESSGPCGFGEEHYFLFFRIQNMKTLGLAVSEKYESSGPCGFGEEHYFLFFRIQNMKTLGLAVSEKKIFFTLFPL